MPNQKLWSLVSVCHILEWWIKRHLCGRGCTIPVVVHWGNDIQTIYCYIFSASSLKVNIIYTHLKYSRPTCTFISTYIYIWICIKIIFLWIFLFPLQCFHSKFTFLQDFQIIKKFSSKGFWFILLFWRWRFSNVHILCFFSDFMEY